MKTLILGGTRSGKSLLAETLAAKSTRPVLYVATARAPQNPDDEMTQRIALHRARRPAAWVTLEEPLALTKLLAQKARPEVCMLVDCLTLWLSNFLTEQPDNARDEVAKLCAQVARTPGELFLVSAEVGLGVIPDNALARRFADLSGELHRELAACCEQVLLSVAGLPQVLKGTRDALA